MRLSEFDYDLPPELIAQEPADERDAARLLVHDAPQDRTEHGNVRDLVRWLSPGDLMVVNDTRVLATRLYGRRASGGRVELLLLEPSGPALPEGLVWTALVNPARKLRPGERVAIDGGAFDVVMIERGCAADGRPDKAWTVRIDAPVADPAELHGLLDRHGRTPLPPYIERDRESDDEKDRARYQTVYASVPGAVAAPTAGLHFTDALLAELDAAGVERCAVTLHVGHGTFQPIDAEEIEQHRMHREHFELSEETADAIARARARGGRIVAIGTTSLRVLESALDDEGRVRAQRGTTDLYLYPGRPVRSIDALFTNFHLPRSSLLLLVCAFLGTERTLRLYREAVAERYRFFSYGDATLLLNPRGS